MFWTDLIPENIKTNNNIHHIGVYKLEDNIETKIGTLNLNELGRNIRGNFFRFGVISDAHLDRSKNVNANIKSFDTFKHIANFMNSHGAKFICVCGDMELASNKDYNSAFVLPIYCSKGGEDFEYSNEKWWAQTMPSINTTSNKIIYQDKKNTCNFYFIFNKIPFIFISTDSTHGGVYNKENIEWLHSVLDKYRNMRCFVFLHSPFFNKAGNLYPLSGATYNANSLLYYENDFDSYNELKKLNEYYKNAIWFNGQTEINLEAQAFVKTQNLSYSKSEDGFMNEINIHVPGCNGCYNVTNIDVSGNTMDTISLEYDEEISQGYIVTVYDKGIMLNGISFKSGEEFEDKYIPIATYYFTHRLTNILSNIE